MTCSNIRDSGSAVAGPEGAFGREFLENPWYRHIKVLRESGKFKVSVRRAGILASSLSDAVGWRQWATDQPAMGGQRARKTILLPSDQVKIRICAIDLDTGHYGQ